MGELFREFFLPVSKPNITLKQKVKQCARNSPAHYWVTIGANISDLSAQNSSTLHWTSSQCVGHSALHKNKMQSPHKSPDYWHKFILTISGLFRENSCGNCVSVSRLTRGGFRHCHGRYQFTLAMTHRHLHIVRSTDNDFRTITAPHNSVM